MINYFINLSPIYQALIATLFTWGLTALGASVVFFLKKVNKTVMDGMLGFAAGVMIAASFWSLLSPGIEMATVLGMNAWLFTAFGFMSGGLLLFISDNFYKVYLKHKSVQSDETMHQTLKRSLMLVFSITLHNIPDDCTLYVMKGKSPKFTKKII